MWCTRTCGQAVLGAVLNQEDYTLKLRPYGRPVQRRQPFMHAVSRECKRRHVQARHTSAVGLVDVGALVEQCTDARDVPQRGRVVQSRPSVLVTPTDDMLPRLQGCKSSA